MKNANIFQKKQKSMMKTLKKYNDAEFTNCIIQKKVNTVSWKQATMGLTSVSSEDALL